MSKCDLSVDDVRHVPMYEEYLHLLGEGVPKERIHQYLAKRYSVSESTVKRVFKRLSQRVTP
jgi:methylphosphotriester-DNA--protein-cysteine methyltransferase